MAEKYGSKFNIIDSKIDVAPDVSATAKVGLKAEYGVGIGIEGMSVTYDPASQKTTISFAFGGSVVTFSGGNGKFSAEAGAGGIIGVGPYVKADLSYAATMNVQNFETSSQVNGKVKAAAFLGSAELGLSKQISGSDHCFLVGTLVSMWPMDSQIAPDAQGLYDEQVVLSRVWKKPIEHVTAEDWVVSYDATGNLKPGRVARLFRNEAKIILDFHGTFVTPGHVYFCAGGKYEGHHVPLIDILRDDGAVLHENGSLIRASTGCEVGSEDDKTFWAFLVEKDKDGKERVRDRRLLRFGTRMMLGDGGHFSMRDYLDGIGVEILESGPHEGFALFKQTGIVSVFAWTLSDRLPNPEDFVLARSQTCLEDIYRAGEWEAVYPRMPAPVIMDGGPLQPMTAQESAALRKNIPMAFSSAAPASSIKTNREASKAEGSRQRQRDQNNTGSLH